MSGSLYCLFAPTPGIETSVIANPRPGQKPRRTAALHDAGAQCGAGSQLLSIIRRACRRGSLRTCAWCVQLHGRYWSDFAADVNRGFLLGSLSQHDHSGGTSCPRWKHIRAGNEFDHESRQEQHVKSDGPGNQDHRHDIQAFIHEHPAKRPKPELQRVRSHGDNKGKANPRFGQKRMARKILNQFHWADKSRYPLQGDLSPSPAGMPSGGGDGCRSQVESWR